MLFLVELDHVKSGTMLTADAGRAFIEQVIFPTLARCGTACGREEDLGWRSGCWAHCTPFHP